MPPATSGADRSKRIKRALIQTSQILRRKFKLLKNNQSLEKETLENVFKPVSKPIAKLTDETQQIVKQIAKHPSWNKSNFRRSVIKKEAPIIKQELKSDILPPHQPRVVQFLPMEEIAEDIPSTDTPHFENKTIDDLRRNFAAATPEDQNDYLRHFAPMGQFYIRHYMEDVNNENINKDFGVWYDASQDKWRLGGKEINFKQDPQTEAEYLIFEDGAQFQITPGIYELLFMKNPQGSTKNDEKLYKTIIKHAGLHSTIRPFHSDSTPVSRPRTRSMSSVKRGGAGLMEYNNKPKEYIYWDDVNELVDRLRLLIGSTAAGNSNHNNEITAIIEELKEAKVIA